MSAFCFFLSVSGFHLYDLSLHIVMTQPCLEVLIFCGSCCHFSYYNYLLDVLFHCFLSLILPQSWTPKVNFQVLRFRVHVLILVFTFLISNINFPLFVYRSLSGVFPSRFRPHFLLYKIFFLTINLSFSTKIPMFSFTQVYLKTN